MTHAVVLAGWIVGVVGLLVAGAAGWRSSDQAEAIACACHEVRGPLTAARLGIQFAIRDVESAEARLRAIEFELERASLGLEDLADLWHRRPLSRASTFGTLGQALEPVDLAQLLADSVEAWQGAASSRGVLLRLVDPGPRAVVHGDRLRLAQVIDNLIANGIEHGGEAVEVGWRVDPSAIRIEVVDGGPGLSAPVAELARQPGRVWLRLGGRFTGRRGRRARRGHGLAIATAVAAAHGGRLASAPSERGARLVLELPNAETDSLATPIGV